MEHQTQTKANAKGQSAPFGVTHIIPAETQHTHTIILLHGRGSTGEEFAEELFETAALSSGLIPTSSTATTPTPSQHGFPQGLRWVFPSSREHWSSVFQENMPAWFEAQSTSSSSPKDSASAQDLQVVRDISDSVTHVRRIMEDELQLLNGDSEKLALGGISQGGAIALWTLLSEQYQLILERRKLGAFIGLSTWLPLAADVRAILERKEMEAETQAVVTDIGSTPSDVFVFVEHIMSPLKNQLQHFIKDDNQTLPLQLSTPVFIGHGVDDAYVDVELGREATNLLTSIGLVVSWKEYRGAEQEGHWIKAPEEIDDMRSFLLNSMF